MGTLPNETKRTNKCEFGKAQGPFAPVSNSQGRNLGRSETAARTSGLSSTQGDLGESGKGILKPV